MAKCGSKVTRAGEKVRGHLVHRKRMPMNEMAIVRMWLEGGTERQNVTGHIISKLDWFNSGARPEETKLFTWF